MSIAFDRLGPGAPRQSPCTDAVNPQRLESNGTWILKETTPPKCMAMEERSIGLARSTKISPAETISPKPWPENAKITAKPGA